MNSVMVFAFTVAFLTMLCWGLYRVWTMSRNPDRRKDRDNSSSSSGGDWYDGSSGDSGGGDGGGGGGGD